MTARSIWLVGVAAFLAALLVLAGEHSMPLFYHKHILGAVETTGHDIERTLSDRTSVARPINVQNECGLSERGSGTVCVGDTSYDEECAPQGVCQFCIGFSHLTYPLIPIRFDVRNRDGEGVFVGRPVLARKDHLAEIAFSICCAGMADGTRSVMLFGRRERTIHLVFNIGVLSRLMTHVRNSEIKDDDYERLINVETDGLGTIKLEPWSLRYVHLSKLPLHSFGLIAHDGHLISRSFVPAFAGGPHFVQLAAENDVLRDANLDGAQRQPANKPGGSRSAARGAIYGALMILLGAALLKVALDSTDAPRNPISTLVFGWGVGLLAAILICQGTVLVLLGEWLFS